MPKLGHEIHQKASRFFIQSSLHVGLAVLALATLSVLQLGFVPEPSLLLFIFFGAICGYNGLAANRRIKQLSID